MDVLQQIEGYGELAAWKQVPELVAVRYKEAANIQRRIKNVTKHLPSMSGYGYCYWHPEKKNIWVVLGDSDDQSTHQRWHNSLKAINGVNAVTSESEVGPPDQADWVRIKSAAPLSWLNKPYEWAGALTGGPSPMSNAVVSGLLGAGAGYGGGWLAEKLLPKQYVDRGRLRKNLALAGGIAGAGMHVPQAFGNMSINRQSTGESKPFTSFFKGDQHQTVSPDLENYQNFMRGKNANWNNMLSICSRLSQPNELLLKSAEAFVKAANTGGTSLRPIPVDAFNNAIWNDVHHGGNSSQSNPYGTRNPYGENKDTFHTPPAHAAATAGLVSGVQQMYGNPSLLSPRHFINGLANAGVDMVTAKVAGGVLGALGGLTPQAQQKLQGMGVWSGMIRGVTGSIFGLR